MARCIRRTRLTKWRNWQYNLLETIARYVSRWWADQLLKKFQWKRFYYKCRIMRTMKKEGGWVPVSKHLDHSQEGCLYLGRTNLGSKQKYNGLILIPSQVPSERTCFTTLQSVLALAFSANMSEDTVFLLRVRYPVVRAMKKRKT